VSLEINISTSMISTSLNVLAESCEVSSLILQMHYNAYEHGSMSPPWSGQRNHILFGRLAYANGRESGENAPI